MFFHFTGGARIKKVIMDGLYVPFVVRDILFCCLTGLRWRPGWRFWRLPLVRRGGRGSVICIGERFVACSDPRHNSLGVFQRVTIQTVGHGAMIRIGNDVGVSGCTVTAEKSVTIGDRVLLGSGCLITDNDAHPVDPELRRQGGGGESRPIVIGNDVFVGARAIILKGVTIGEGCVIGAGAVVTKSVPAFSICAGNPARVVGDSRRAAAKGTP